MEATYKPPSDFELDSLQPLVDLDLTGSKELWLIQCPMNQFPEIDGKELEVKLDKAGLLGCVKDSSGKEFDLVSFSSQDVGATVILPSGSESKIVGKISRRVSLVRYPEPSEVIETMTSKAQQRLTGALTNSSNPLSTPLQSNRMRSTHSALRNSTSAHSSRHRSSLSGFTETPKALKRKHSESVGRSHLPGSSDKSKKKIKSQE
ncbi:PREDICTED: mediator-associated protein 2 [Tarenaya hassleriana]|uniref:mediator-associated protein 2 n=1 Tax=Tarenaya hassleriana TaxID=28532 RepID=UPI00053C9610|nr:PREDICTED: mediator-associated protein 2 [Tarenaya hassleriana]